MDRGSGGSRQSAAQDWARALNATAVIAREPERTLPDLIDTVAGERGDSPALIGEAETLSYAELVARSRRYARWAHVRGLGTGHRVALLMPNGPNYLALWLGFSRIGVVTALLNTSLTGSALAHAVRVSEVRHVIVAAPLRSSLHDALDSAFGDAPDRPHVWTQGSVTDGCMGTDPMLSDAPLRSSEGARPKIDDTALLIFTSGTTGLPKASLVSHRRVLEWSLWFAGLADTGPEDRMYLCLPMYHSVGGIVAPGALLVRGGSVVIRERFSTSRFWPDVVSSGATIFQYIGELCRYLTQAPTHVDETRHRLRLCLGNGLAAEPWRTFAARFGPVRILEFYASTEGNLSLYNCEGEIGAIGRIPPLWAAQFPLAIVRCDPESGELLRGPDGLCIACAPDEIGEALGRISSPNGLSGRPFEGYTDADATARKIVLDVRETGDRWFRTGDLMRRDRRGFVRFVERTGETFRWKGENVSCAEVAAAIRGEPNVQDVAVYGVPVPNHEGKAGMAALAVEGDLDIAGLHAKLMATLPGYARPVFLRICRQLPLTDTFKPALGALRAAGFDPSHTPDPIFALDRAAARYVLVDAAVHARISLGAWPC